jgi:endoribonuclease Dicer
MINEAVRLCKADYEHIKCDYVIGFSAHSIHSDEVKMLHRRQEMVSVFGTIYNFRQLCSQVLGKFRKKELNVLVSTSVLEEGIDVRQCNLVVRFDPCRDYVAYVQSKGRARKPNALFVTLADHRQKDDVEQKLNDYYRIEQVSARWSHRNHVHV